MQPAKYDPKTKYEVPGTYILKVSNTTDGPTDGRILPVHDVHVPHASYYKSIHRLSTPARKCLINQIIHDSLDVKRLRAR